MKAKRLFTAVALAGGVACHQPKPSYPALSPMAVTASCVGEGVDGAGSVNPTLTPHCVGVAQHVTTQGALVKGLLLSRCHAILTVMVKADGAVDRLRTDQQCENPADTVEAMHVVLSA